MNAPTQSSMPANMATPIQENMDDEALADWINQCLNAGHTIGYLHAQYLCKVFNLDDNTASLYTSDPEKKSKTALRKLARRGLLQQKEMSLAALSAAHSADPTWHLTSINQSDIAVLVDTRLQSLGRAPGRGTPITQKTAWQVWADAGGRCMYTGCGKNLTSIPLYNKSARVGYLAHIVASDQNGPRGNAADSHRLSDNAENIMLMCDAHHRLIDCFAPAEYPADRLYEMRQAHRDLVHHYLDSLSFPRTKAITLHANLAQVPTYFNESDLIDAILDTGRAMLPKVDHHIRRCQRDDRRTPEFWVQYLSEHELDIQTLVNSFSDYHAAVIDELAVFPLHHIATMVLAGRIIGEARAVRVFQYHRQRGTWRWDPEATPQPVGTFSVDGLSQNQAREVLITIELTANLDEGALPASLAVEIDTGRMPWVRIRIQNPSGTCISHPDDLDQFRSVARQAINHVQDVMRASEVRLIAISPASSVFCFGQMLQAGHHPTYTIYDRASRDTPFCAAFSISGHDVTASAGTQVKTIMIR